MLRNWLWIAVTAALVSASCSLDSHDRTKPGVSAEPLSQARLPRALEDSILTGRVLEACGAVAADRDFVVEVRANQHRRLTCRTDSRGSFRFALPRLDPIDYAYSIAMAEARPASNGVPQEGVYVAGSLQLGPGEIDLGDLTLGPSPIGVSGRVIDQDGKGVADAYVQLGELAELDESKPAHATRRIDTWKRTKSGPGGWFSTVLDRGEQEPPPDLVAYVSHGDLVTPVPVPFRRGDHELELRLSEGSGIQVDSRLIESGFISPFSLTLLNLDGAHSRSVFGAGTLHIAKPLRPGRYVLAAKLHGQIDGRLIVIGEEIHLKEGELSRPVLLNPVIIENYVSRYQFKVLLPDGTAPAWVGLVHRFDGGGWSEMLHQEEGVFTVATAYGDEAHERWICAPGTRWLDATSLVDGETLQLREGIRTTVKLAGPPGPDPFDDKLRKALMYPATERLEHSESWIVIAQRVFFDTDREGQFLAPYAGEFKIRFDGIGMGPESDHFAPWQGATFQVTEEGGVVQVPHAE